jgi:hypothetical protein
MQLKDQAVCGKKTPGATPLGWWGFTARVGLASRYVQDAIATPGPSRGHPIGAQCGGILQKLEVKLYAVLQLPGGKVSSG